MTGPAADVHTLGAFDRLTFVLPILVPWYGMAEVGPIHTISASSDLLVDLLAMLPGLLAPGGLALLYCQDWVGGGPLPAAIDGAMLGRSWQGAFWWDTEGTWRGHRIRTGCLAIQADTARGWADRRNTAPDVGVDDWWPHLGALLLHAP
ncbi:MAG: hypothetical protein GXP62_09310 [Oligoflexia bacterium]|nr:hypothetical protein [Oligoflexia bacterium]